MSTLDATITAQIEAFAESLAACDGAPESRVIAADQAAQLAGNLPSEAQHLSGPLNLCRAALLAISTETSDARATKMLNAISLLASIALEAAGDLEGPATSKLGAAASALMQALSRYQSGEDLNDVAVTGVAEKAPFSLLPEEIDAELLGEFITECRDYVEKSEGALLALETNPDDDEAINMVFRAFHTIKGTAGFVGTVAIVNLAHRAETLFSRVRDHEVRYEGVCADLALRANDLMGELLDSLERGITSGVAIKPDGYDELLVKLEHTDLTKPEGARGPNLGDVVVSLGLADRETVEKAIHDNPGQRVGDVLANSEIVSAAELERALKTQQRVAATSNPAAGASDNSVSDATLRVRTDRLDKLIDTVGELVIAHSMLAQNPVLASNDNPGLSKAVAQAGKLVRELQDLSMTMRMVPVKATFQKMERLVRDLARKSGKKVNFITEGEDTEIDRTMVDAIADPLVHMIRNSVDHGLETVEARIDAGKSPTGTVRLVAGHIGGSVVVTVEDDGRGLNRDRIIEKAMSKGLISNGEVLSERQAYDLIFLPGFSTAEQVTDVSGRGVGMDVVKRNVAALGGHIEINSTLGMGSAFSLFVPLTLAVTEGMLVRVGEQRFIIPTRSIALTFRPEPSVLTQVGADGEVVQFRNKTLPVVRLHRLFDIPGAEVRPENALLVVVEDPLQPFALLVDSLLSQQQVVTKPLGAAIGQVQGIAGAAILGDGRVGLILDTTGISALAHAEYAEDSRRHLVAA